jgi:TPR repeat protein
MYAGKATAADQTRARDLLHKACDAGEPAACRALQSMPK